MMSIWERYDDLVASNAEDQIELTRLRAQQTVLVSALAFYGEADRYEYDQTCCPTYTTKKRQREIERSGGDILPDCGETAREALATLDVPDTKKG